MNEFDWVPFYEELADKLLEYKNKRSDLFEIIKNIIPKNDKLNYLDMEDVARWECRNYEIDPFTIFSIFNRLLTIDNKIKLLEILADEFKIKAQMPNNFYGVPLRNSQKAVFGGNDEVWELLEQAIICSKTNKFDEKFYSAFEKSIQAKNNGLASITMALFWVRPNTFLNLDSLNRQFLEDSKNNMLTVIDVYPDILKGKVPNGEQYISMCRECKKLLNTDKYEFSNFVEMSYCAYVNSKEEDGNISKAEFLKWFNPLIKALKDLGGSGTPKEVRDKIAENENLSDEVINEIRGKKNVKKFDNDIAFARNYLVYENIIMSNERGIWKLSDKGYNIEITNNIASDIFVKWYKILKKQRDTKNLDITYAYFVGANINNKDMVNDFITNNRWESGYNSNKHLDFVKNIEVGDRIALKSAFTQKNNLPFNTDKNNISVMRIKAIGTVTKNYLDGKNLDVQWEDYEEDRDWYFFTGRQTIWKVEEKVDDWIYKSLLDFTFKYIPQDYDKFLDRYGSIEDDLLDNINQTNQEHESYNKDNFLKEVFMNDNNYEILKNLLKEKKNIILQGSSGVGKTYTAKRLAYSIMGKKDNSRVKLIQFHQSYSYEDFIMGYRPCKTGFELKNGVFYDFCNNARDDIENDYFFIIDEINRGNLSKIFGELFMLIENDKRDEENAMKLIYDNKDSDNEDGDNKNSDNKDFYVPKNVHIIGMMNTADRSLAVIDYALRRRFAFFNMKPAFKSDGFKEYQSEINNSKFDKLVEKIIELNTAIESDISLGSSFKIGHSYFVTDKDTIDESWLNRVVEYELIPILQEYWFDENENVKMWSKQLKEAIL